MANAFNKEEIVVFEDQIAEFDDNCVLSSTVEKYDFPDVTAERTGDVFWRPQPYIVPSFNGLNQTGNFLDKTQLSVPSTIGFFKSVPWQLSGTELRDPLQAQRLMTSAFQRLASDVNQSLNSVASLQGTLVVKRTAAASGFDDVAQCEAIMNEQGVLMGDRFLGVSTRDYNGMASNLASRQTMAGRPETAYAKALVGAGVANFDVLKMDTSVSLAAAAGVTVTITAANQFYTPKSTSVAATGETGNVDNRYQTIGITVTSGTVKVGDSFTIAGVNAIHQITKQTTGQLKTFRVAAIVTGAGGTGTISISPPIISAQGATPAEVQYQNVSATPAAGAAVTFLNTATAFQNPFWHKGALEIIPGDVAYPGDAGWQLMNSTTPRNGMRISILKQGNIQTGQVQYRVDCKWGVVCLAPEQSGIILFSQP